MNKRGNTLLLGEIMIIGYAFFKKNNMVYGSNKMSLNVRYKCVLKLSI